MPAHLVELEDLSAVPAWFRDLGTDWVRFFSDRLDLYRPIAGRLGELLNRSEGHEVIDLCSGAGGGWLSLLDHLDALGLGDVWVTLTDKYPHRRAAELLARAGISGKNYKRSKRVDGERSTQS